MSEMSDGILFVQCDDCGLRFHVVFNEELDAVLPGQYCPQCGCPDLDSLEAEPTTLSQRWPNDPVPKT